jgi:Tfp pilus tip-associated adhesin PilY1
VADVIRLQGTNGTFYIDNNLGDGQGGRSWLLHRRDHYTGNWSDRDDGDAWGNGSRTTYTNGARARWYVKVPAGTYDVDVWIPSMDSLSRNTDYHIYHNGGTTNEWNFSQQYSVNRWREIGDDLYFSNSSATRYDIPVAHYFATDSGTGDVYLVALSGGSFTYYLYTDSNGNDRVDDGELSLPGSVPASVQPSGTYAEVRQNFANWYSFYRRRELTAKSAIGQVIDRMEESQIGMAVLNNRGTHNHTVLPVKSNALGDQSAQLLTWLYAINSNGGTPLRRGLQDVGQYFDLHDGGSSGYLSSTPPWASEAAGGGCQRAFAIAMTDGYYNGSDSTVESPLRTLNADSDGVNRDNQPSGFDRGVFLGPNNGSSPTLADISMYYYENDLNRSLTNVVPSHNYDIANHQHMTTFGVAFGVHGEIDPAAWLDCLPKCDPTDIGCYDPVCPTWVAPTNQPRKIDDLYHAAVNGRGQFFTADDPQQLLNALLAVMQGIQNTAATGSSVAINAQELQGDTALYQATYIPRNWTGDVKAKPLDPNTGGVVQELDASNNLVDRVDWSAADQLDAAAWTGRKIITYNDASTSGAIFDYAFISPAQRLLLDSTPAVADAMIDFLRGDTSLSLANGGVFRDRDSLLGDIVHASPVPYRWDRTQPGVVFVGANDGMLHMLDEVTGNEIFGYVPNLAFANLRDLTIAPYAHKYFVDSEPYITKLGSTGQTILVGGMGRGGRGYYCLDISGVSNPAFNAETNAAAMVKWEYPVNSDPENKTVDPDMGYSFSQAYAVNSADGWVVIFGNGYDSQNGEAVLYVLPIDSNGNQLSAPTKIRTYVGDAGPNCNGLSTPALIDVNQDGLVDFAFAGDLLGNMWKFDLRDNSISNWTVAYNTQADGSGMPQPLFQAKNQAGFRQPITTRPDVMRQCRAGLDGYLVLFGTGRYLGLDDFADADAIQSLYGIWDWGDAWENLNSVQHSAARRDPTAKYLGEFDTNRQLSNLVNNAAIPDTEQTLYIVGLGSAGPGDEVRINGRTFTFSTLTNVENYEFLGSAGLQVCVNDSTYGVPDVFAQASPAYVVLRTEPPGGSIAVTATPGVELGTIDLKVTLASQNVIYADDDFVVVSQNPVEWFDPRTSTGLHAGWYFDMPGTSERLVNDVIIRDGILYAVPNIPSESPCEAGGNSIIYALNACTGGGLWTVFDIDGDGRVNNADLINIGTAANPIWVAPSGLRRGGLLYSPAILTIPGTNKDVLHFSTSSGNLETEIAIAEKLGFLYWRTW